MSSADQFAASPLPRPVRRRSLVAAYANAALWGVGSGLASTTLITYLARAHGAAGTAISWILAAPALVGLLRLAAPLWLERVGSRRRFGVAMFLASAAVLASVPVLALAGVLPTGRSGVIALGAAWAGYQLLESFGVVALWSWLGDLAPRRVRGRFLGRREAWLNAGVVVGSVAAIGVTAMFDMWSPQFGAGVMQRRAYAACAVAGAAALAVAALSLLAMAHASPSEVSPRGTLLSWRDLAAPLVDAKFRRFLTFGLWFSVSNGLVQLAQSLFPLAVLDLSFAKKRTLDGALRLGKAAVLPRVGALVDHRGNVGVLAASQGIIALAPLFFLFATPTAPWWILGAYVCWLAYAGHDVTLTNLMLGLSPPGATPQYAAAWFTWTQLAYSLSVLAGGVLFDWLSEHATPVGAAGWPLDHFAILLAGGWVLKSMGVALAARIQEPTDSTSRISV
jgi:MFS family permease